MLREIHVDRECVREGEQQKRERVQREGVKRNGKKVNRERQWEIENYHLPLIKCDPVSAQPRNARNTHLNGGSVDELHDICRLEGIIYSSLFRTHQMSFCSANTTAFSIQARKDNGRLIRFGSESHVRLIAKVRKKQQFCFLTKQIKLLKKNKMKSRPIIITLNG